MNKFCSTCKHYGQAIMADEQPTCRHPERLHQLAALERLQGVCGEEGRNYEYAFREKIDMKEEDKVCDYCEEPFDRPMPGSKCEPNHAEPTLAQRIQREIEQDIRGRRGMDWGMLDDEVIWDIRDSWTEIIQTYFDRMKEEGQLK